MPAGTRRGTRFESGGSVLVQKDNYFQPTAFRFRPMAFRLATPPF